ncbi:MAG: GGDEF domain-containing protein [Myxococcales bacterium]|nr:GGDEF domain-containing protein [Myxococcales bacterium]
MKLKHAAVIEPNQARWKALAAGLKKAGLIVSSAKEADELGKEQLVVLGASAKSPSRLARLIREKAPNALLLAAQSKGFKAPFADAVLPLPLSVNDLKVRLAEWANRRADDDGGSAASRAGEGILDPTTNFYTFSHFKEVLFVEVKRARRYGFPLALALLAFDPIKGVQHVHSQLMGGLALAIRRSLRDTDYPVQYSADRVLLLMPHTDLAGTLIVARRICERVSRASLQSGDDVLHPTISVGVAAGEPGREYGFSDLVRQAQDGLTQAMARGGNRVEFYDASTDVAPETPMPPTIPPVAP